MSNQRPINCLEDYAEALVKPLKVLVIDTERGSFEKITNALAHFDADIYCAPCACPAGQCLQFNAPLDLIFVGVPLTQFGTPDAVLDEIQRVSPDASVVIMSRNPMDADVVRLMERGPFTFLKKNGSFDQAHIQRIANQLNLKLRPSGKAVAGIETPATASVNRV